MEEYLKKLERKYAPQINNKTLAGLATLKEQGDAEVICPTSNQTPSYETIAEQEKRYLEWEKTQFPIIKEKIKSALNKI